MDVGTSSLQGKLWKQVKDLIGLRHYQSEKNLSKYLLFWSQAEQFWRFKLLVFKT